MRFRTKTTQGVRPEIADLDTQRVQWCEAAEQLLASLGSYGVSDQAQRLVTDAFQDLTRRINSCERLNEPGSDHSRLAAFGRYEYFLHESSQRTLLLTAILADGINLGLTKMAEACLALQKRLGTPTIRPFIA